MLLGRKIGPAQGKFSQECASQLDNCPQGHEMAPCPEEAGSFKCKQCSDATFQPDRNVWGDKCRLRKVCNSRPNMTYKDYGSTIRDADCKCRPGYHFENIDQRACVPNKVCDKGYGQGDYGKCEKCIDLNMYSDKKDKIQTCQPLTNCEKDSRCTKTKSNGTFDNVCGGSRVKDVAKCENATAENTNGDDQGFLGTGAVIGLVVGSVVVILFIIFIFICLRRRRQSRNVEDPLTEDQFKKLMERIIEKSDEEEAYCKKVLSASFREIEDRIDRQKWSLAQELFRNHYQPAMYEVIVDKYKDKECKFAVNGYLQDWREYMGETAQSVQFLFRCLKQCRREDIVYEICNKFREVDSHCTGYPEVVIDAEAQLENGVVKKRKPNSKYSNGILSTLFPCSSCGNHRQHGNANKQENNETKDKLLNLESSPSKEENMCGKDVDLQPHDAGAIYRERPSPSAPVIDEAGHVHVVVPFNRAMSFPIQASS
ncbi:uncharacterized protein LOC110460945 isoform X8 [Mizuhopecten yessoensis]|uniref:uncharacterized protein LOC110460945 isoform X8 n=1 Tax=Mizuhopecten yessoensis TaxID=6573 RepID=UPI000B45D5F3|nr:uncharacterized protein LOC110460945 isoform X8 [Mizuhopecten yessoensis]